MMKIKIFCIGKLKEAYLKEAEQEYLKRLSRFCKVDIIEINDIPIPENSSFKDEEKIKDKEFENLTNKIDKNSYNIFLDLNGKEYTSIQLARKILDYQSLPYNYINFFIGGSLGFSRKMNDIANEKIRLSNLTFTHQMTRIIFLEQLYRSFKINANESYHK